ncbi:hypothetical protein [Nonomuraea turcica]|uniref:hypothetical protein n=1 Tax=Nonomuraea sp. G32 TaxID=3067274 RepID=UPI00273B83F4|nr:hypothetical protein [Nonomuraea sp. G32]MDP4507715.1 hypothetical protein [Nonomuraea sp. G32]
MPSRIQPQQVPELRFHLHSWLAHTAKWYTAIDRSRGDSGAPSPADEAVVHAMAKWIRHTDESARRAVAAEASRIAAATLYYVSEDMTHLALQAGRSLPRFVLRAEDAPSAYGFMVWGTAIRPDDIRHEGTPEAMNPIVACSWSPIEADPQAAWWVSFYTDTSRFEKFVRESFPGDPAAWQRYGAAACPPLWLETGAVLSFSDESRQWPPSVDDDHPAAAEVARWTEPLLRTLLSTWLLMGQNVTTRTIKPDNKTRTARTLAKRGRPLPTVRLVDLAGPHTDA